MRNFKRDDQESPFDTIYFITTKRKSFSIILDIMKKIHAFLMWSIVLLSSCSDLDKQEDQPLLPDTKSEARYLRISLLSSPTETASAATRAGHTYVDGTESENQINNVKFFFFNDAGQPAEVGFSVAEGVSSTVEWTAEYNGTGDSRRLADALLSLYVQPDQLPTQVVAVVNPTSDIRNLRTVTLQALQNKIADYQTNLTDHNFMMSNSVYLTEQQPENEDDPVVRTIQRGVAITDDNIGKDVESLAPVEIVVDRIVARVDIKFGGPNSKLNPKEIVKDGQILPNVYDTGVVFKPTDQDGTEKKVYVQLLGWAATSSPIKSRLIKSIDQYWNTATFFSATRSWNSETDRRSFWAVNPVQTEYKWYSYDHLTTTGNNGREAGTYDADTKQPVSTYLQENANPFSEGRIKAANPTSPTKVIFGARLIDENGNPLPIAEYNSTYYTPEGLIENVANDLKMFTPAGSGRYEKITSDDLTIETAFQHGTTQAGPGAKDSYYVYFTLSEEGRSKRWYYKPSEESTAEPVEISNPLQYLENNTFPVKIWEGGQTYYFLEIKHAGVSSKRPGYVGVVRNHIYDITITQISKLGTPVYSPEELIYPEETSSDPGMLEATIKALEWRIVTHNLDLSW